MCCTCQCPVVTAAAVSRESVFQSDWSVVTPLRATSLELDRGATRARASRGRRAERQHARTRPPNGATRGTGRGDKIRGVTPGHTDERGTAVHHRQAPSAPPTRKSERKGHHYPDTTRSRQCQSSLRSKSQQVKVVILACQIHHWQPINQSPNDPSGLCRRAIRNLWLVKSLWKQQVWTSGGRPRPPHHHVLRLMRQSANSRRLSKTLWLQIIPPQLGGRSR